MKLFILNFEKLTESFFYSNFEELTNRVLLFERNEDKRTTEKNCHVGLMETKNGHVNEAAFVPLSVTF